MISKKYRVSRLKIEPIIKKGKETQSSLFLIRYITNNRNFDRFAVIISKKINKLAVKRNLLRRQLFESIRDQYKENLKKQHFDIVLIPKKIIINKTFQDIKEDVKNILSNPHLN